MTNQMVAPQMQYNPLLSASMQSSHGNTFSMPMNQRMVAGFQQYNPLLVEALYFVMFYYNFKTSEWLNFATFLYRVIKQPHLHRFPSAQLGIAATEHWTLCLYFNDRTKSSHLPWTEANLINLLWTVYSYGMTACPAASSIHLSYPITTPRACGRWKDNRIGHART